MCDVYYKIYYYEPKDYVTVVCMQWFDEHDYIKDHFLKDENGRIFQFNNKEKAIEWVIDNINEDKINPEYKKGFNQKFYMKNLTK